MEKTYSNKLHILPETSKPYILTLNPKSEYIEEYKNIPKLGNRYPTKFVSESQYWAKANSSFTIDDFELTINSFTFTASLFAFQLST